MKSAIFLWKLRVLEWSSAMYVWSFNPMVESVDFGSWVHWPEEFKSSFCMSSFTCSSLVCEIDKKKLIIVFFIFFFKFLIYYIFKSLPLFGGIPREIKKYLKPSSEFAGLFKRYFSIVTVRIFWKFFNHWTEKISNISWVYNKNILNENSGP